MIISENLEKVFDKVQHLFMTDKLKTLIYLIMFVLKIRGNIIGNGEISAAFSLWWGIRQGY